MLVPDDDELNAVECKRHPTYLHRSCRMLLYGLLRDRIMITLECYMEFRVNRLRPEVTEIFCMPEIASSHLRVRYITHFHVCSYF